VKSHSPSNAKKQMMCIGFYDASPTMRQVKKNAQNAGQDWL
jgi:hypothetical protein